MIDSPTRWSANVICDGAAQLWYFIDGRPVTQALPGTLDIVSPVEHLLLATAGCYAMSCRAVLAQRRRRHPFEVIATAEKSAHGVHALSQVALTCIFAGDIAPEEAERITAAAQTLSTVGNTLVAAVGVSYQVHVLQEAVSGFGPVCAAARLADRTPEVAAWPAH